MATTTQPTVSLEAFLAMPETQPASEYIDGKVTQKPMSGGRHSRLQGALITAISQVGEPDQIALAFPELRCTFGGRAIVPDVAVYRWERVPFIDGDKVPNDFSLAPDWAIEIFSSEQSPTKLIDKLVHCIRQGGQVGWLVDAEERAVTVFLPGQLPTVLKGDETLPVLPTLSLVLTASDVFGWLQVRRR